MKQEAVRPSSSYPVETGRCTASACLPASCSMDWHPWQSGHCFLWEPSAMRYTVPSSHGTMPRKSGASRPGAFGQRHTLFCLYLTHLLQSNIRVAHGLTCRGATAPETAILDSLSGKGCEVSLPPAALHYRQNSNFLCHIFIVCCILSESSSQSHHSPSFRISLKVARALKPGQFLFESFQKSWFDFLASMTGNKSRQSCNRAKPKVMSPSVPYKSALSSFQAFHKVIM